MQQLALSCRVSNTSQTFRALFSNRTLFRLSFLRRRIRSANENKIRSEKKLIKKFKIARNVYSGFPLSKFTIFMLFKPCFKTSRRFNCGYLNELSCILVLKTEKYSTMSFQEILYFYHFILPRTLFCGSELRLYYHGPILISK